MFDFDFGKLMVVAIVALAVIPPKDLPRVMRTVGQVVGKKLEALNEKAKVETSFDPATMIRDDVKKAVEAPVDIGTSKIALNPPEAAPPSRETAAEIEADLDDVRRELEALNEKAKVEASFDPKAAAPAPPSPAPHETPAEAEAPAAKQSAAE